LFAYPDISRSIDALFFACHLTSAHVPSGSTPYAAISEVPPGHYLVFQDGRIQSERYWRFEPGPPLGYRRQEQYVEHFEEVFGQAIRSSLRASSKPAVLLSGGLDSSYVTAVAAEQSSSLQAIHAFVPGSSRMDEREYARAVASHLNVDMSEVEVSDCWSLSRQYLTDHHFDQPNIPVQAALMVRMARETASLGSSVLLDGIGGDEFLSGGPNYICSQVLAGRPLQAFREARGWARAAGVPTRELIKRRVVLPLLPGAARRRVRSWRGKPPPDKSPPWMDPFAMKMMGIGRALPAHEEPLAWDARSEYSAIWTGHESSALPVLGWRERQAALPYGVEIRSPFWDLRVVELVSRMPGWVHRDAGRPKAILRAAMRPRLPERVVERTDKGIFDELLNRGILGMEYDRVVASLNGPLADLFYVRTGVLQGELENYRRSPHPWWHGLWRAITGGIWLQAEQTARTRLWNEMLAESRARPVETNLGMKAGDGSSVLVAR
jgi:asparagine synthase (glutamine-hydrolysing)